MIWDNIQCLPNTLTTNTTCVFEHLCLCIHDVSMCNKRADSCCRVHQSAVVFIGWWPQYANSCITHGQRQKVRQKGCRNIAWWTVISFILTMLIYTHLIKMTRVHRISNSPHRKEKGLIANAIFGLWCTVRKTNTNYWFICASSYMHLDEEWILVIITMKYFSRLHKNVSCRWNQNSTHNTARSFTTLGTVIDWWCVYHSAETGCTLPTIRTYIRAFRQFRVTQI